MSTALSGDLRGRTVAAVEDGSSIRQAAARFAVGPSAAVKPMRRVQEIDGTPCEFQAGLRLRGVERAIVAPIPPRDAGPEEKAC